MYNPKFLKQVAGENPKLCDTDLAEKMINPY